MSKTYEEMTKLMSQASTQAHLHSVLTRSGLSVVSENVVFALPHFGLFDEAWGGQLIEAVADRSWAVGTFQMAAAQILLALRHLADRCTLPQLGFRPEFDDAMVLSPAVRDAFQKRSHVNDTLGYGEISDDVAELQRLVNIRIPIALNRVDQDNVRKMFDEYRFPTEFESTDIPVEHLQFVSKRDLHWAKFISFPEYENARYGVGRLLIGHDSVGSPEVYWAGAP